MITEGDEFMSIFPFPNDQMTVVVESVNDYGVVVERPNGVRQLFPESTLLNQQWWVRV